MIHYYFTAKLQCDQTALKGVTDQLEGLTLCLSRTNKLLADRLGNENSVNLSVISPIRESVNNENSGNFTENIGLTNFSNQQDDSFVSSSTDSLIKQKISTTRNNQMLFREWVTGFSHLQDVTQQYQHLNNFYVYTINDMYPVQNWTYYYLCSNGYTTSQELDKQKVVNCSFKLRLQHFQKYDKAGRNLDQELINEIRDTAFDIVDQLPITDEHKHDSDVYFNDHDFLEVQKYIVNDSAPGLLYKCHHGINQKKDALDIAKPLAQEYVQQGYITKPQIWGGAGRGKRVDSDKPDASRSVEYPNVCTLLAQLRWGLIIQQIWKHSMYKFGYAIGHSWFNQGADKFVRMMCNQSNVQDWKQLSVVSLDIASWDASFNHQLIDVARQTSQRLLRRLNCPKKLLNLCEDQYNDMCNAIVCIPGSHNYLKFKGGMKSGWGLTAHDNTSIHTAIITNFLKKNGYTGRIHFQCYGDDNFLYADKSLDVLNEDFIKQIRDYYAQLGMTIKDKGQISFSLLDNDFLSKHFREWTGTTIHGELKTIFVPWRDENETFSRLAMPDTVKVKQTNRESERMEAFIDICARAIGHYIDNYFNHAARQACEAILKTIFDEYGINVIKPGRKTAKFEWRDIDLLDEHGQLDVQKVMKKIPNLYLPDFYQPPGEGAIVPHVPATFIFKRYNEEVLALKQYAQLELNDTRPAYSRKLIESLEQLIDKAATQREDDHQSKFRYQCKQKLQTWKPISQIKGNSGYRLLEIMKAAEMDEPQQVLLVGSHPGSDHNGVQFYQRFGIHDERVFPNIHGVSIIPHQDRDTPFHKIKSFANTTLYPISFDEFVKPEGVKYDYVHIDATVWEEIQQGDINTYRNPDQHWALVSKMVYRCFKHFKTEQISFRLCGMTENIAEHIYTHYFRLCSKFVMLQSAYGYNNNVDIMVYMRINRHSLPKKEVSLDAFRSQVMYWYMKVLQRRLSLTNHLSNFMTLTKRDSNPLQSDETFQIKIHKKVGLDYRKLISHKYPHFMRTCINQRILTAYRKFNNWQIECIRSNQISYFGHKTNQMLKGKLRQKKRSRSNDDHCKGDISPIEH